MAKIETGRLGGPDGMDTYSASELLAWADKLEAQLHGGCADDPLYVKRWLCKIRRLADQKERSLIHKLHSK